MAQRFRFRLETVLRVREVRERETKRKFGAKQAEIARLDWMNDETAREIRAHQNALLGTQRGERLDAAALTRERAWIGHLRRAIVERQVARAELVAQLDRLRTEFQQARTARRVIEKLRERRFAEYQRERKLREQSETDELAQRLHATESEWLTASG